ncbi:MAG: hypothetical protein ACKVRO_14975 [Micropepsaceae bacterium]
MDGFQMSDWVAVASAAVSVLALVLNIVITSRQTRVSVENFKFNNDTQLMNWANRVVAAMSEAYHISPKTDLHALATNLSALIDEGRWFFPNIGSKSSDPEKPGAYRGARQAVLDHIVAVYDAVIAMPNAQEEHMNYIREARRHFVSEIQHSVDPRRRAWVMDRFKKF